MVSLQQNTDFTQRVNNHHLQKLARFRWYRQLISQYKKQKQLHRKSIGFYPPITQDICVYNHSLDITSITSILQQKGVYCGLNLDPQLVQDILHFAQSNPCVDPKQKSGISFYAHEYNQVKTNTKIYRGLVTNTQTCVAIRTITYHDSSLALATSFLGYSPSKITTHLTWSFPVSPTDTEVYQQYAPTNWHYDVVGEESLTLNFYITDVMDGESGPHEYIETSHGIYTPWQLRFSGNIIKPQTISKYFCVRAATPMEYRAATPMKYRIPISVFGAAGFGFAEDPSCIHRVKPPTSQSRLILQIRYS